jgi:DNA-binding NarL/FixJ family response regulator
MTKIKIILVDDHHIVRDGIKSILQKEDDIDVIAEASDWSELSQILENCKPDIILMDISLPGKSGIEITKELNQSMPEIKVLILSMYINDEFIMKAVNSGACGYLPKNTSRKELLTAVRSIIKDGVYYNSAVSDIIMKNLVKGVKQEVKPVEDVLTKREIEILKLVVEGLANKEIADKLFISSRTVESHKNHIMQKLDLKSQVDLVKFAIRNNIVEL